MSQRSGKAVLQADKPPTTTTRTTDNLAIEVVGLVRRFGQFTAVAGVDLSVQQGELFSLLGPNGAGKTTLIKMLCCLLTPTSGSARVMGHDIGTDPLGVKDKIAIAPQETAIAERLTARENLRLLAGLHGIDRSRSRARSDELLTMMALEDRADEQVRKYSGGMKRRLSLAMALVSDPQVLFLDEPTLGLDPQSRRIIWNHIEELKEKATVVLTTHYLEEADALADTVAIIDDGNVIAQGSPGELKAAISDSPTTVIEADHLSDAGIEALKARYPVVRRVGRAAEIDGDDVNLVDVQDCLDRAGVVVQAAYRKQVTLDDVFLQLTGKELRQ